MNLNTANLITKLMDKSSNSIIFSKIVHLKIRIYSHST